MQIVPPVSVDLGGLSVRRLLPRRVRRMVGPWCFLDLMGPVPVRGRGVDVPPHPHIGLQTVTWLLEGSLLHKDSLDSEALAVPGALNLMTSGSGIAHSEETPPGETGGLHGVQLWLATPDRDRHLPPSFEHHARRPEREWGGGARSTLILGEWAGRKAPGRTFSPLLAAEVRLGRGARAELPLDPGFEHALVLLGGRAAAAGEDLAVDHLAFLEPGPSAVAVAAPEPATLLLLGGAPFGEEIVMWWNFVARTHEEVKAARDDWQAGRRFGEVGRYAGARLEAPPLLARAVPVPANPMS
jgi:redox-sensitive bicupin YhaK (pirin superfamily)